jgi:hypothetical protein
MAIKASAISHDRSINQLNRSLSITSLTILHPMGLNVSKPTQTYSGFQISKPQRVKLGVECRVWGVVNPNENGCSS